MTHVLKIWPDNVVFTSLLSNKLTFLSAIYCKREVVGALVYEQDLSVSKGVDNGEAVLKGRINVEETPAMFSYCGGNRWVLKEQQDAFGLKLEIGKIDGKIKSVKEVRYQAQYDYTHQKHTRIKTVETGKKFAFTPWYELEGQVYMNNKMVWLLPVYMIPDDTVGLQKSANDKYPYYVDKCGDIVKPRFLGCKVSENGQHYFEVAERLPEHISAFFMG